MEALAGNHLPSNMYSSEDILPSSLPCHTTVEMTDGDLADTQGEKSAYARSLLSALLQFIQPIAESTHNTIVPSHRNTNSTIENVVRGVHGHNLVSALTDFIKAATQHSLLKRAEVDAGVEGKSCITSPTTVVSTVPKQIIGTELEAMTLTKVRWHVFNKMPIRMLAFDSNGGNVNLIGRDEIFSRILPKVFAHIMLPGFKEAWEETLKLEDVIYFMTYRQHRQNELLAAAVEECAHYGILSHTWIRGSPGDVVFHEWAARELNPMGHSKINKLCEVVARNHNVTFGWMDTVCIDKQSSSELDESIRLMYKWYRGSHVCVTYLSETSEIADERYDSWFTRGWTLQDSVLAPVESYFYNNQWKLLGSVNDKEIQTLIRAATDIRSLELELCKSGQIEKIPISRRLQLAANRQVTREEDGSYSLMGILGVDITIAYGEGTQRAFFRLVRELLSTKKFILDIFNRGYTNRDTVMPSSLKLYTHRKREFDSSDGSTYLDRFQLSEPVLLTHLGVRMTLLFVPGLAVPPEEKEKPYTPRGSFSGQYKVSIISRSESSDIIFYYNLLDDRLYADNLTTIPVMQHHVPRRQPIAKFAILNFFIEGGDVCFPDLNIGLLLYAFIPGGIPSSLRITGPADNIVISAGTPPIFRLTAKDDFDQGRHIIPVNELDKHGMQLITLYL